MTTPAGHRGFTLIEVLIAMTIMGLVMVSIGTAFSQLAMGSRSLEDRGKESLALGEAAGWIGRDLEALYVNQPPLYKKGDAQDDADPYRFTLVQESVGGEEMSFLRFTSLNHLPFGGEVPGGIAEVVYFGVEEDGILRLRRSDRLFFHEPFEREEGHPTMLRGVTEFKVVCIDAEGVEQDTWDSESDTYGNATPVALKVTLSMGGQPLEAFFLLRSVRKEVLDG